MAAAFSHAIRFDGTILNTLEDLAAASNHTCEMHGWPTFAVDEYRYKVGNGMLKLVERFMPAEYAGDGRMFEQTLAEFRAYYGEHKEDHTSPYAGTIEMLDRLRTAGVQLAVLTNTSYFGSPAYREILWPRSLCAGTGPCGRISAQARGTRHVACDERAGRRSGNHALCGRFECRCSDRPQRRP